MDFGFGIFEKLKEIYNGIRKLAWGGVALVGTVSFFAWALVDWLAARAVSVIDWLASFVPTINLNPGIVTGIDWPRINQFVPVTEAFAMFKVYLALAAAMGFVRLLKKFVPIG